jgi:fructose-bisphosphate aldolase class I
MTIRSLKTRAPPGAGRLFLSGAVGRDATARLNAMNQRGPHPWELSFSYGRALAR